MVSESEWVQRKTGGEGELLSVHVERTSGGGGIRLKRALNQGERIGGESSPKKKLPMVDNSSKKRRSIFTPTKKLHTGGKE